MIRGFQTMAKLKKVVLAEVGITLTDAGKLLGKSLRWTSELLRQGHIKPVERGGLYRPAEVVRGYIANVQAAKKQTNKSASLAQVQTARASEIELRVARAERKIIKTDEAIAFVDEVLGVLKADFDGAAASITRDPALRGQIEGKINEIFNHAADRYEQKAAALRSSSDAPEADTDDASGRMGPEIPPVSGERRRSRGA
jgi:hypothetical protein